MRQREDQRQRGQRPLRASRDRAQAQRLVQAAEAIALQVEADVLIAERLERGDEPRVDSGRARAPSRHGRSRAARPCRDGGRETRGSPARAPRLRPARSAAALRSTLRRRTECATTGTPTRARSSCRAPPRAPARECRPWSGRLRRAGCARRVRAPPGGRDDSRRDRRRCCRRRSRRRRARRRSRPGGRRARPCSSSSGSTGLARYSAGRARRCESLRARSRSRSRSTARAGDASRDSSGCRR